MKKLEIITKEIKEKEETLKKLNENKPKSLEDLEKNLVILQISERYVQRKMLTEAKEKWQNELGQIQQQIKNIENRIDFVNSDTEQKAIQGYIDFLKEVLNEENEKKI